MIVRGAWCVASACASNLIGSPTCRRMLQVLLEDRRALPVCHSLCPAAAARMSAVANAATYDKWFKIADQDMDGRVTGPDAVV